MITSLGQRAANKSASRWWERFTNLVKSLGFIVRVDAVSLPRWSPKSAPRVRGDRNSADGAARESLVGSSCSDETWAPASLRAARSRATAASDRGRGCTDWGSMRTGAAAPRNELPFTDWNGTAKQARVCLLTNSRRNRSRISAPCVTPPHKRRCSMEGRGDSRVAGGEGGRRRERCYTHRC